MTLFLVFLLSYVLSQFYRSFLAVIAPEMAAELGLDTVTLANVGATFFAVFALAQFPLGVALDRIGPRRTVPALMLVAVAGALLLARAGTGLQCILANGLIGLGCSPIYMGALYILARTKAPDQFGTWCGYIVGIGTLGNLLAATPLSMAAQVIGWRGTFDGMAVITALAAAVFWAVVRDPARATRPTAAGSALAELGQIVGNRQLWPLFPISLLAYGIILTERGLWIGPFFSEVFGLDAIARGNAALVMAVAMSAGAIVYGMLDRVPGLRKRLVAAGSLVTAMGLALLAWWPDPGLPLALALVALIGFAGLTAPVLTAHARVFFPDHLLGRGITFINFLFIGGAGLVQWLSGLYVASMQSAGLTPAALYGRLHLAFAITLAMAVAIYVWTRANPRS